MLDKDLFRKKIKTINKKFKNHNFKEEDNKIITKLISQEYFKKAETVLLYYPLENEVNVTPLIDYCLSLNKNVGLPKTYENDMDFFKIGNNWKNSLLKGKFGIKEPINNEIINANNPNTLIIVPALAYGKNKSRIGHGKGYYDKFLKRNNKLIKIGLSRKHLLFKKVPMENNDIFLDHIIFLNSGNCKTN